MGLLRQWVEEGMAASRRMALAAENIMRYGMGFCRPPRLTDSGTQEKEKPPAKSARGKLSQKVSFLFCFSRTVL